MILTTITRRASAVRTVIFTVGHFFIDFFTIVTVTGSTIEAAAQASILAPILNGAWYYLLDRAWTVHHKLSEDDPRDQHTERTPG